MGSGPAVCRRPEPSSRFISTRRKRSLRLEPAALEYFQLHIDLDVEHGNALQEGLLRWATTEENQDDIHQGARRSLDARAAFWSALAEQLFPDLSSEQTG